MPKKSKISVAPFNPEVGQLYYEPYTCTMRRWNGKGWLEVTPEQVKNHIMDDNVRRIRDAD